MAESKPQFANFGEAFCAYYRVRPEKYERAVLWRALPWSRRLLAVPILVFNRTFFATDLDIIRNLKPIQSVEEFSLQLDELYAVNRVERNIRRGFFGIRASGSRLMHLWKLVEPYVNSPKVTAVHPRSIAAQSKGGLRVSAEPSAEGTPPVERVRASGAAARRVGRPGGDTSNGTRSPSSERERSTPDVLETSPLVLRRLHRACNETVSGLPLEQAVSNSGLEDVPQFLRLLSLNAASNPSFGWLLEQLRHSEIRRQLETENARLQAELAENRTELARLREQLSR